MRDPESMEDRCFSRLDDNSTKATVFLLSAVCTLCK